MADQAEELAKIVRTLLPEEEADDEEGVGEKSLSRDNDEEGATADSLENEEEETKEEDNVGEKDQQQ
jgi:hypothetical protein